MLPRTLARATGALKKFLLPEHGNVVLAPFAFVVFAALCLGLALGSLSVFQHLEWSLYNREVEIATRDAHPAPGIVVVAIDEPSFQEFGLKWPWPRSLHAALIRALHEAGARTVVFDIVFDSPSPEPGKMPSLRRQSVMRATSSLLPIGRTPSINPIP